MAIKITKENVDVVIEEAFAAAKKASDDYVAKYGYPFFCGFA